MSSTTARSMTILQHIPFVVRFKDRVKVRRFYHHLLVTPTTECWIGVLPCFFVKPCPNRILNRKCLVPKHSRLEPYVIVLDEI